MPKILFYSICSIVALIFYAQAAIIKTDVNSKIPWTLTEALGATASIRNFNGTWITDAEFYFTASDKSIQKYNVETNEFETLVQASILEAYGSGSSFTLSPDNNQILVRYGVEKIFRHSSVANYDVVDLSNSSVIKIQNGTKLIHCQWSPITDRLSYVYENDVYIHLKNNKEVRLTNDGKVGIIYNGVPDWVYEEEVLSSGSAMWWSKDGKYLAVATFDDTYVETFTYYMYGDAEDIDSQYPKQVELKYPKAGTPNPKVGLLLFDLSSDDTFKSVNLTAPTNIVSTDHILQHVAWVNNSNILVTWINRRQNVSSLQLCDVAGNCKEVKHFEEPNGWIEKNKPICVNSGNNCIFTYWINNWYQIWNLDLSTGANIWKSRGNFTVINIYGFDEINNKIYYQATLPSDPAAYHIFSNDDCLSCQLKDVDGNACSYASASFSRNFAYYTITCTGPTPSYTKIFVSKSQKLVKDWVQNEAFRELRAERLNPTKIFMNVTLADGSIGYAQLSLPPNFDETKKYAMIVFVYGGPNSVRVTSSYSLGFEAYITTNRNAIYTTIDGRSTGNKGQKTLFAYNNRLGMEYEDQIFVTKFMQNNLPYVDANRTAIWGWSFGGYSTARTLAKDNEHVFQCGVSVAPVTSWLYYDSIYTERYMGLPTLEDNLVNYIGGSLYENIKNFRTHDFLLVHGSGDDNVHYQHSLLFAKVLQHNDILFDQMTYTDEAHSLTNTTPHLYNTIEIFFAKCIKLDDKYTANK